MGSIVPNARQRLSKIKAETRALSLVINSVLVILRKHE